MQKELLVALMSLGFLVGNSAKMAEGQESTPGELVPQAMSFAEKSGDDSFCGGHCVCLENEVLPLPGGLSYYVGTEHDTDCGPGLDCESWMHTAVILPSGLPMDDCPTTGCSNGGFAAAMRNPDTQIAGVLESKVPHDFRPKFSPKFSGEIKIIHSDFITFVDNGASRRAKIFLLKVASADNSKPVRIVGIGFEVEDGPKTKATMNISRAKDIKKLPYGVRQVKVAGIAYGVAIAASSPESMASASADAPTLAVRR